MGPHIEQRESEGIVILDLKGPLTLGHGDLELRDRLPALHQSGNDEQDAVNRFFPDRAQRHFDVLNFARHEDNRNSERGGHSPATLLE